LSSIPGSVGAGVFGNVGAFGREIKSFVFGVWVFDTKKKEFIFFENKNCNFSYRNSFFKVNSEQSAGREGALGYKKNNKNFLIYSVVFDFSKKFQKEMKGFYKEGEYFSLKHFAKKYNLGKIEKSEIRKSIKKTRKKFFPNVKKFPNVGSTFGNTEITKIQLKNILKIYPDIPN
jgi:UDP-N-acetylmuramate dehydrogenase